MESIIKKELHSKNASYVTEIKEHRKVNFVAGHGGVKAKKEPCGTKIKLHYEAYNAVERCEASIFNGKEFNVVFDILDTGIPSNYQAYSFSEQSRKDRAEMYFTVLTEMCESILS